MCVAQLECDMCECASDEVTIADMMFTCVVWCGAVMEWWSYVVISGS